MKKIFLSLIWLAAAAAFIPAHAQTDICGATSYFLPNTSLVIEAEAVKEIFYAGPYAKYASKYLGIEVREEDQVSYTLSSVKITPFVEADQSKRYVVEFGSEAMSASFLQLTSLGLISKVENGYGEASVWRFVQENGQLSADNGLISNVANESTTLYRGQKSEDAFTKVAVQQSVKVAKTVEQKAAETASLIFSLRQSRIDILTGNTDATYSGEAMGAAVAEIEKLEKEYLSMFTGYSVQSVQAMQYDLVPTSDRTMYIAFRFSESNGLLAADDQSGKPIVLDIEATAIPAQPTATAKATKKGGEEIALYYRIPALSTVKLRNGADVILTSRFPIYQYGATATYNTSIKTK